jgi:hypothetical protein
MNNVNTARTNDGIAATTTAADTKEVVDFAERVRHVLELKITSLESPCRNQILI